MRFMLSALTDVFGAVVSVDLRLQLHQKDVCSGLRGKTYSFTASARIQAHTPRWGLRRRHCAAAEFWVKTLVNPERKPRPLFEAAPQLSCFDLPEKCDPDGGARPSRFIWFGRERGTEAANGGQSREWAECLESFAATCAAVAQRCARRNYLRAVYNTGVHRREESSGRIHSLEMTRRTFGLERVYAKALRAAGAPCAPLFTRWT